MRDELSDFDAPHDPPLAMVDVPPTGEHALPADYRKRIAIYTPHDGRAIPKQYRVNADGGPLIPLEKLAQAHLRERDWGANLVASELASALEVPRFARVQVARVLLDFNRFPGSTPADVGDHLQYLAIGPLYAEVLSHRQKMALLETYYDGISDRLDQYLAGKLISIGVHTYDERNPSATRRADVSLISLPLSYQRESRLRYGVFDPMYPDDLAESTCSRILRDRVSLELERAGFRVLHNHPYAMPDGSIELRAQVWYFFQYLRRRFLQAHPETRDDPAYEMVWTMLLDTNLRLQEAELLRSFLHRFRKVPPAKADDFNRAMDAYGHVRQFVRDANIEAEYRRSPERPSSLGIEVRKDLLCTRDPQTGRPRPPTAEQQATARRVGQIIADAIQTYVETDREA